MGLVAAVLVPDFDAERSPRPALRKPNSLLAHAAPATHQVLPDTGYSYDGGSDQRTACHSEANRDTAGSACYLTSRE